MVESERARRTGGLPVGDDLRQRDDVDPNAEQHTAAGARLEQQLMLQPNPDFLEGDGLIELAARPRRVLVPFHVTAEAPILASPRHAGNLFGEKRVDGPAEGSR